MLDRAIRLTEGLSDEGVRWGATVEQLKEGSGMIAGDVVVAASMLTYAGAFVSEFRKEIEDNLALELDKLGLLHS